MYNILKPFSKSNRFRFILQRPNPRIIIKRLKSGPRSRSTTSMVKGFVRYKSAGYVSNLSMTPSSMPDYGKIFFAGETKALSLRGDCHTFSGLQTQASTVFEDVIMPSQVFGLKPLTLRGFLYLRGLRPYRFLTVSGLQTQALSFIGLLRPRSLDLDSSLHCSLCPRFTPSVQLIMVDV